LRRDNVLRAGVALEAEGTMTETAALARPETQTDPLYINDAEMIR